MTDLEQVSKNKNYGKLGFNHPKNVTARRVRNSEIVARVAELEHDQKFTINGVNRRRIVQQVADEFNLSPSSIYLVLREDLEEYQSSNRESLRSEQNIKIAKMEKIIEESGLDEAKYQKNMLMLWDYSAKLNGLNANEAVMAEARGIEVAAKKLKVESTMRVINVLLDKLELSPEQLKRVPSALREAVEELGLGGGSE